MFDHAQERYRKTVKHLHLETQSDSSISGGVTGDQALFLQAESFYRYRPELRKPGVRSFATSALAATTDFSPLSVWAASTEIAQLRMQSYNGAVQLYEALLERFPDSELKPLVLYRLGWAYRNIGIEGFPRNGQDVLKELMNGYPASPFAPWAEEMIQLPFKTQGKAAAWSLIPGAGQMYVGEWRMGAIRLSIATAFAAFAIVPPIVMVKNQKLDWLGLGLSLAGIVGLQVSYTMAYQDAQRSAIEFNERQEKEFEIRHPDAP